MDLFNVSSGAFEHVRWTLLSIVGEEAVSELFSFTIHALAARADLEHALHEAGTEPIELSLVGQTVCFQIEADGIPRYGVVATARVEGAVERGGVLCSRVRLEVVPRAWLLTQRRNSRIFQHLYVHQIVSKVLCDSGIKHRWNLGNTYRKRVYCTQYDETDYEFVTRLLAEEGIFFYFSHEASFTGGPSPDSAYLSDPSGWETAAQVAGAIGKVATAVGGLSDSSKGLAFAGLGGRAAYMFSDLMMPPKDEEADDPRKIDLPGEAGPGGAGDVFVFIDDAGRYPQGLGSDANPLSLTLRDEAELDGDHRVITELHPVQRVRAQKIDLRDYDFRRPMLLLEASARADARYPGYAPEKSWAVDGAPPLDVYAHHGEYETPELDQELADNYLGQFRADALVFAGRSYCPRLAPGYAFGLHNATATRLTEGSYAVTRVRHEWYAPSHGVSLDGGRADLEPLVDGCARAIHEALASREPLAEATIRQLIRSELGARSRAHRTYQNRFDCVPAAVAYRPPRPRRITRNVTESATVVGPIGIPSSSFAPSDPTVPAQAAAANEIYTDRFGRVKIQFHWDRDGKLDENSSCWVRVVQTWSGAGFGFQFIPRVGMEVLVTFLAGDPDRPVVIGTLYNATHATPEPLPQRGTRSGIRTQSSPGGGGFNELSFEDQKGVERVHIHAQKDFEEIVNDTHTLNVKNVQKVAVTRAQEVNVGADQIVTVGQNRSLLVGGNQSDQVRGNRTVNVARNETTLVNGNALHAVDGVAVRTVKSDETTVVDGDRNLTVHGTAITHVGGRNADQKSSAITFVQGSSFLTATERVVVKAEKASGDGAQSSIRLECGDSFIEIHHDKITLSAKAIEILGGDATRLKGKDAEIGLDQNGAKLHGEPVTVQSSKGSHLQLDGQHATVNAPGNATVMGNKIDLKSAQSADEEAIAQMARSMKVPNLKLVFTHLAPAAYGNKIAGARYRVVVEDLVYENTTNGDGMLQVWAPDGAKVAHVVLWANEKFPDLYPDGPLVWLVHLISDMSTASAAKGARLRLRNLAYDPGTVVSDEQLDDVTQGAILEFQLDQDLPPSGALDDATTKKLDEAYGTPQ